VEIWIYLVLDIMAFLERYKELMTVDKLKKEFHFLKNNLIEILENI